MTVQAIKDEIEDPERLAFIDSNPYIWESYSDAEERGYLEGVKEQPWDKRSSLHIVLTAY